MLAHQLLNATCCGVNTRVVPRSLIRLARFITWRPVNERLQQQSLQKLNVACAAGLQIGKLYTASAKEKATTFEQLQLAPTLLEAMKSTDFSKPTEIQALAVPAILSGGDVLLCSQTGSGKTLAYLLPIVHMLKQNETAEGYTRRAKRPKVIVLGPTKELVDQIGSVAKSLCHFAKFKPVCCNANTGMADQAKKLSGPVDVVVATPQRLLQHQQAGNVALGDVQWLVIDEADTMFDQGFGEDVTKLIHILRTKQPPAQVVLVSATMTKAVKRLADAQLPNLLRVEASGFHKPTAGARQEFRVLPPGGDKLQMLLELLQSDVAKQRKVLVFCGSVDSCRAVEHSCADRDLPTVCYHGDMPIAARKESMAQFAGCAAPGEADAGAPSIMVATDLAARGLDFSGSIDHVINFDFPTNAIDYLHRSGRTARAGAKGLVTSLLGPRDRKLATAIQYALDKGLPLDQVTASGAQQVAPQQQQGKSERWMPPPRHKREKGPAPVKGQPHQVRWNSDHKFLHVDKLTGKPLVPFKDLLKGTTGDERRKLLGEIAMDVKEYRRQRYARDVARAAKKRQIEEKRQAARGEAGQQKWQQKQGAGRAAEPEERWKQKLKAKSQRSNWGGRGKQGKAGKK